MVGQSYIRLKYSDANEEGRKIYINIEPAERSKGIPTADIPIPTLDSSKRLLIPTGGNADDFTISAVLHEESSQVAVDVSTTGIETDQTDVRSITEQWDFIFDEIYEVPEAYSITASYELYLHWNNKTYNGWSTVQSQVDNEKYTGEVPVRILFKSGKNPLNLLT